MKMNDYISDFCSHIEHAIEIGLSTSLKKPKKEIKSVLICGLGGSGIGASIMSDILYKDLPIAIRINKGYSIPAGVDENTLVIACSYSGNTEETIISLENCVLKNAEICVITSGGKLKSFAEKNNFNLILIPGGHPPRAMFGYSFTELFFVLYNYDLINDSFISNFKSSVASLTAEQENIKSDAKKIAEKLYKKTPVIYVCDGFEGVAVRLRQQINENSKMLCWHHVVPEMNHNELLGWRTNTEKLAVLFLSNKIDDSRNKIRVKINKKVLRKYTKDIMEVQSKGDSLLERSLYLIHVGDWISWYLSVLNNVDAIEIDVINYLKAELAKIS